MILKIYKNTLSTLLVYIFGSGCIYTPTCSEYATVAIGKYGLIKGSFLGLKRFLRCNSFTQHDFFDPVR